MYIDLNNMKTIFIIIFAITLFIYFIGDIFKYKISNLVEKINSYAEENEIYEEPTTKESLEEFYKGFTVSQYIYNYNYLKEKKSYTTLSKHENILLDNLSKDIKLLKVSFLSVLVSDNPEDFPSELLNYMILFKKGAIFSQILKMFKTIFTITSLIVFINIFI